MCNIKVWQLVSSMSSLVKTFYISALVRTGLIKAKTPHKTLIYQILPGLNYRLVCTGFYKH